MTQPSPETTAVQPTAATAGAVVPFDYSGVAGATGFEGADPRKDLGTPFLAILQKMSKAVDPGHAKHVKGAQPGMFLNTGTGELIPGTPGFAMVPIFIEHCVVEWAGDPGSGKFVARHDIDSDLYKQAMARFNADKNPAKRLSKDVKTEGGNALVETYYLWSMILGEDGVTPVGGVVLPFKSTNIAIYRQQVYTRLQSFKVAGGNRLWYHRLRCTLAREDRPSGVSFNYRFEPLKGSIRDSLIDPASDLFRAASELVEMISTGRAKMADPADEAATAASGDGASSDPVFG